MVDRNSWEKTLGGSMSPGDVVAGKYRIERVIGRGGMGVVVQAWHLDFDEPVAIKFLLPDMVQSEEALGRFEREARANFKIKSEHVAQVIDVGKTDSGIRYIVMEYLEGCDLADVLVRDKRVPYGEAVDLILQACDAVAEAHANGIVHRDLKPENLFVTQRPDGSNCLKVLDFGLSKVEGGLRERALTSTFQLMGTPQYMSPEQWMSASDVGPASDLWALGIILYEMIAGVTPFRGDKLAEVCAKVMEGDPPPFAPLGLEVPPELEAVIHACLRKQPSDRLANVGELAVKLHPFARRDGRLAAKRASGVLRAAGFEVQGTIPSVTIAPERSKSRDRDPLASTELMDDEHTAAEVRRAHAALAARERALAEKAAANDPQANPVEPRASDPGVLPDLEPRASVTTIVMAPPGEEDIAEALRARAPRAAEHERDDNPTLLTIVGAPRPRRHTPTAAYDTAPEVVAPPVAAALPFSSADGTRRMDDVGGPNSPWAIANSPAPAASSLEVTVVGPHLRPAYRTDVRKRQARWMAVAIVLAVFAGVLAVTLVVHAVATDTPRKMPAPVPSFSVDRGVQPDPVPDPVPGSAPADGGKARPGSRGATGPETPRAAPTMLGSSGGAPGSASSDAAPKIPTARRPTFE